MSDRISPMAQTVVSQRNSLAIKDIIMNSTTTELSPRMIMTTDGGNDTEPEEAEHDDTLEEVVKTSPKKRAATNTADEDGSPKKKRVPAGGKAKASNGATKTNPNDKKKRSAAAKSAASEEEQGVKSEDGSAETLGSEIERPTTPEAQTSKAKTPKTPKTPMSPQDDDDDDNIVQANDTTPKAARGKTHPAKSKATPKPSPTKGKRAGAEKVADKVVLPTKWSEAKEADKTLVRMKEAGHPWSEIRVKWFEMTGQDTAPSTLPNRYKRLQVIMMELQDGEKEMLLEAKAYIESNWKTQLWALVATKMEESGARKYPADFLSKEFRKMEAAGAIDATPATVGAYAPTSPAATKGKASAATNGKVKNEDAEDDAVEGGTILLAAAASAMEGESEAGADGEAAEEEAEDWMD